jgi:hypothetical protein
MSSGSHMLTLLSKHWWLNCSTLLLTPLSTLQNCQNTHIYTRLRAADVISLLYSICNFDFVVTIVVIVQMCLDFKKSLQERSLGQSSQYQKQTIRSRGLTVKCQLTLH